MAGELFTLILISCLTGTFAKPLNKQSDCEDLLIQSDICIRKAFLFSNPNATFPQTSAEVDKYCILGADHMKCVKNYAKCLKPLQRQVFGMMMRNFKTIMRDTCDTQEGKQEFLEHSKCMTKENMARVHRLLDKATIHMKYILENTTKDQKLPYLCCSLVMGKSEMDRQVRNMCESVTGSKTLEYINRLFNQAIGEAVDLGCGNKFGTESSCKQAIGASEWNKLQDVISDNNYREQATSFLVPVIGITQQLDD